MPFVRLEEIISVAANVGQLEAGLCHTAPEHQLEQNLEAYIYIYIHIHIHIHIYIYIYNEGQAARSPFP